MSFRLFALTSMLIAVPALAQAQESQTKRTRIFAGPQLFPATPGASDVSFGPFVDISRARPGELFEFEAPDEGFGFPLIRTAGFEFGPALGFKARRKARDVAIPLHEVGFSVEIGGFVQAYLTDEFRVRAEARKAVSGHRGWVGEFSADYIVREGDDWLLSVGPRVTLADRKYHRAWFGITPTDSAASGLPTYAPGGGVERVGVTVGYLRQLTPQWGIAAYGRYDRLIGDAADSPYTRTDGSRSQPSAGLALSYTFGGR